MLTLLWSCYKSPYTGRSQFIIIDRQQELALGAQASREILNKEKVIRSGKRADAVKTIGSRIAKASGRTDFNWEFHLIDKPDTPNAFCLPGGKVFVYTGIMELASNRDELATVMGHEIAHALDRHGAERMSHAYAAKFVGSVASAALNIQDPTTAAIFDRAYGVTTSVGVLLPFSRQQELEADHDGLILMSMAGYNPEAAVGFWKKMKKAGSGKTPPVWLSTHPPEDARIRQIKRIMPEIKKKYYRPGVSRSGRYGEFLKQKYVSRFSTNLFAMRDFQAPYGSRSHNDLGYPQAHVYSFP